MMNDVKGIIVKILHRNCLKECNREYKKTYIFVNALECLCVKYEGRTYNYRRLLKMNMKTQTHCGYGLTVFILSKNY